MRKTIQDQMENMQFTKEKDITSNLDYWIVKSYGDHIGGEKGYIRIKRNISKDTGLCGIAMRPSNTEIKTHIKNKLE